MIISLKDKEGIKRIMPLLPDLHYLPEYLKIFQEYQGHEAFYYCTFKDEDYVITPYFKRPIEGTKYYDIISPWYFGGPITNNPSLMKEHLEGIDEWCITNNVVSEFQRLNPVIKNHELYNEGTYYDREVAVVDLTKSERELYNDYNHKTRKNITRAEKNGLRVLEHKELYDQFIPLYTEAMDRKTTGKFYYFNKNFFDTIMSDFDTKIFTAMDDLKIICSSMEIGYKEVVYDYLRGTDNDYLHLRPNDIVLHKIILWAKNEGYKTFVIGGGNTKKPDDGQLRFKASFTKTLIPFYVYKKIHQPIIYGLICRQKGIINPSYEKADYFPEYNKKLR